MTSFLSIKNNAFSYLAASLDATSDPILVHVQAGQGTRFPSPPFHISIESEILKCTIKSGDVLTCLRAQEETVKASHGSGVMVKLKVTAQLLQDMYDAINALEEGSQADTLVADEDIDKYDICYISAGLTGTVLKKASASLESTGFPLALALEDIPAGSVGKCLIGEGVVTNTAWSYSPGLILFLSTFSGRLGHTPPQDAGNIVAKCGYAITPTQIRFVPPIEYFTI